MYTTDGNFFELTLKQKITFFTISLVLNTFGSALSLSTALGTAPWTAAGHNLSIYQPRWSVTFSLMVICLVIAILNVILGQHSIKKFIGSLVFGFFFGAGVGVFVGVFDHLNIHALPLITRIVIDIIAICLVGCAISIYQRLNWIIHSVDDLTNVLRFNYFKGNASYAQMSAFLIAIGVSVFCFLMTKRWEAIGMGTAFSFFCQGYNIAWSDRYIFPKLIHRNVYLDSTLQPKKPTA